VSKKLLLLIILFSGVRLAFAQQNTEFRLVKEYYDSQRINLLNAFKKEAQNNRNTIQLEEMKIDFSEFMSKMDSIQNVASIGALIRVKNREDLQRILQENKGKDRKVSDTISLEIPAEYPGGINTLRQQVADLFYFDALLSDISKVSTNIYFVVEKDGSISSVRADGENFVFNRQAEIAVYMLPEKFTPATFNGEKVRYSYRIPLTMKFK